MRMDIEVPKGRYVRMQEEEEEELTKDDLKKKYGQCIVEFDRKTLPQWCVKDPRQYNTKFMMGTKSRAEATKERAKRTFTKAGTFIPEALIIKIMKLKNDQLLERSLRKFQFPATRLQTPGRVLIKTYEGDQAIDLHPSALDMLRPFQGWPMMSALLKITIPREKMLTEAEIAKMKDDELISYARALEYWRTIWFVQKFYHYHTKIRNTTLQGEKEDQTFWRAPPLSCPITVNVLDFDWKRFLQRQYYYCGRMFDVIVTDPPWTLATEKSTRGVALNYDQITDAVLLGAVPFEKLLGDNGVLFMWVINAKMRWALQFMKERGLKVVSLQTWFKMSTNDLQARGHGYYLQHAKEDCIVAVKGDALNDLKFQWDALFQGVMAHKRCQSQKPTLFYDMVEQFVPDGFYLEVFGRRNNLRNGWISIGNQL